MGWVKVRKCEKTQHNTKTHKKQTKKYIDILYPSKNKSESGAKMGGYVAPNLHTTILTYKPISHGLYIIGFLLLLSYLISRELYKPRS